MGKNENTIETPDTNSAASEYVMPAPTENEPEAKPNVVVGMKPIFVTVCNCDNLNIRTAPSRNAGILEIIRAGTKLAIKEFREDGWAKIDTDPGIGAYVMQEYIKRLEE